MPEILPKETAYPFTLRLTRSERAILERKAAGLPLGEYIRLKALGDSRVNRRKKPKGKLPSKGSDTLSQLLGELGRMRIASNLSQLVTAVDSGSLVLPSHIHTAIQQAFTDLHEVKNVLMQALRGKYPVKDHEHLVRLLDDLGRMNVADHLNQQAKAVNVGCFVPSPETTTALLEGGADIRQIRDTLLRSLEMDE